MEDNSLKQQAKRGLYWSAAGNVANQGMRFVFGIILARLLAPSDYGVIGMLTVFICVVQVFIDCGFSQALLVKQDRTQTDFSTEFYFNIAVGVVGYALLFIASPFIANFYNMPILSPILKVTGLGVIINSLCVVQSAQFAIRLDFKTPAKIGVVTNLTSGIVGIVLAYFGWGIWALVLQQVGGGLLGAILLWIFAKWRPTREFSKESFNYLWGYGSKILGASLIQQVYDNLYPLVIGKFYSSQQLGLYSRAQGFASLPSTNLSSILGSVTFPILSKLNNDVPRLISSYRRMIKTIAFIVFPLMIGLAALSSPLVKVLLNEQWYDCIIYLQLLCIALIWQPLSATQLSVIKVLGRSDIILKLEVLKRGVGVISIFAAIPFGVKGMCIGYDLFYVYCFVLNTYYNSKILNVSFWGQIKDILPLLINSIIMGGLVLPLTLLAINKYILLFLCTIACVVYYYTTSSILFKEVKKDAVSLIKRK